jgi:hypothetical protein
MMVLHDNMRSTLYFSLVPMAIILIGIVLIQDMYPIYIQSNTSFGQDPAYQYLFAGLDILQGHSPVHTDHPGTPLQSLIAITLAASWLILRAVGGTSLVLFDAVLHRPEYFLTSTTVVLLALTGCAVFFLGRRIFNSTQSYPLALSCQFSPILYAVVTPNLVFPTPEALLISISVALIGVLAPVILSPDTVRQQVAKNAAIWVGVLCGVGVATKLTFVPMLGLLFLLKEPRLIVKASLWCVIAWFIGVLPILPRLPGMFKWFYALFNHSGIHGAGAPTVFDFAQVKLAIGWLMGNFSIYYRISFFIIGLLVLGIAIKIFSRLSSSGLHLKPLIITSRLISFNSIKLNEWLVATVFLLVLYGQTLMVAKHLGPTYMIPALGVPTLAIAWLLHRQQIILLSSKIRVIFSWCWLSIIIIGASFSTITAIKKISANKQIGLHSYALIQKDIQRFQNSLVLGAFNCNFANCALWFGMSLVPEMELRMASVTPNFYYFDVFSKKLHLPGKGELNDAQTNETIQTLIEQGRSVLLISPPFPQLNKFKLKLITETPIQNLYQILGIAD